MSSEIWTQWEGQVINGTFPLRRFLGGSERGAIFLSEYKARNLANVAIKLVPAVASLVEAQLAYWRVAGSLSHPHLIRLFDMGRCQLGGRDFLFVVMEHADQTLAQVLSRRALDPDEVREMLLPTLDALVFLHRNQLVHAELRPSNIVAVNDQLKLTSDTVRPVGSPGSGGGGDSSYDPPEPKDRGISTAIDIWSLGIALVEAFTQHTPMWSDERRETVSLPASLPAPFMSTVRRCLNVSPAGRPTALEIESQYKPAAQPQATSDHPPQAQVAPDPQPQVEVVTDRQPQARVTPAPQPQAPVTPDRQSQARVASDPQPQAKVTPDRQPQAPVASDRQPQARATPAPQPQAPVTPDRQSQARVAPTPQPPARATPDRRPSDLPQDATAPRSLQKRYRLLLAALAAFLISLAIWIALHSSRTSQANLQPPAAPAVAPVAPPEPQPTPPSPVSRLPEKPSASPASTSPSVVREVTPDVPRKISDKIQGRVFVTVRVLVDPAGSVIGALPENPGPSKYFARLADQAAREWKFVPADQQATRVWLVRFRFTRDGITTQVTAM